MASSGLGLIGLALAADAVPPRRPGVLHCETVVPVPLPEAFAFFADAANLERLTPPWLNFSILTPMPVAMRIGVEIDYAIRVRGLPMPWRSIIDVWEPGDGFVDRQIVGPYRWWRHQHRFLSVPKGTLVVDHVEYAPRAAWLSSTLVRRDLDRIFAYRREALQQILGVS
jgi:ligand-binding SRPBCC domain-containing protein